MKKQDKKILLFAIATIVTSFGIGYTLLKGTVAKTVDTSVDEQRKAVLQVAHTYYRQGGQYGYDFYRKNLYSTPEDATSQHYIYTVCSGFTFQVYYQSLGIEIPDDTESLLNYAEKNKDNKDTIVAFYNGAEMIYSEDVLGTSSISNYNNLGDKWVDVLKPGDIFVVTGHSMLVDSVDVINRKITIIEAAAGASYNYVEHRDNYDKNGTIQYRDLADRLESYYSRITSGDTLLERMAVIRFITDGNSYIKNDNEISTYTLTDAAISRLKYPEIDIEKIVKVHEEDKIISQNILTNIGESITYELTITNNSSTDYDSFNVVENIDSKTIVTDVGTGLLSNDQIKWTVSSLKANESITLTYIVKVKDDKELLGKTILSTGYVENIATSKIETLIGNKLTNKDKEMLSTSYEKLKNNNQIEREFINQLYLDAFNLDIGLVGLDNLDIISYDMNILNGGNETLSVKSTKVNDTKVKKYIYNNFYGLRIGRRDYGEENIVDAFSQWNIYATNEMNDRVRTLTEDMLNEGDIVLVYTGETDTTDKNLVNKSYIYLNNKLIRKKSSTDFEELYGDGLTAFLRNIVGDNYIILRPSIAMFNDIIYSLTFSSDLTVDEVNRYIKYLNLDMMVSELLEDITITNGEINVYDQNNNRKNLSDKLGTGDRLVILSNDEIKGEYTISVLGDSSGDGRLSVNDLAQFRKHLVKWVNSETGIKFELDGVYSEAFDLNKDGKVSVTDLAIMRKKIVGLI